MRAFLVLEDGTVYEGRSIGRQKEIISEIVFNTSMTGYEEVLTDPSYTGQAVVMTYPLIGNYGVCEEDMQSGKPHADAFIVRDISRLANSWRAENTLQNFLTRHSIGGIAGIDTRDLTRRLRDHGTMNGCITTALYEGEALSELIRKMKAYRVSGAVERASVREIRRYAGARGAGSGKFPADSSFSGNSSLFGNNARFGDSSLSGDSTSPVAEESAVRKRVALLDAGTKAGIVESLTARGLDVTVYPSFASAEEILADQPDGIMISNGPGDPADNTDMIREIRKLALSGLPIFAICLGHQLMALAMGGSTYKLKFGHRGANHPVKDLRTGRVYITSQNHGYAVDESSIPEDTAVPAFRNLNDGTNEGFLYKDRNILTVQFHPEASPGPCDSGFLFDEFAEMMSRK
ncbi:MAG: carbamoyl phosphate synthase small subunit [Lachnospiraceae bacterium]|nr:carbamoyl phosphate synthase small subunit [Lachnospiraceae bacterium]